MAENVRTDNLVMVSGVLHHSKSGNKSDKYFLFSVKQETPWFDGSIRKDFLVSRAFIPELQAQIKGLPDKTPIKLTGSLQSSKGSGEMYIYASEVEILQG